MPGIMYTADVMVVINKLVTFHRYLNVFLASFRPTKSVRRSSMYTAEVMVVINKLVTFHRYLDVFLASFRPTNSVRRSSIVPFPEQLRPSFSIVLFIIIPATFII